MNGNNITVTASPVTLPGPISDGTGIPIVFNFDGQNYYAYRQETPPDFSTTAAAAAGTMAIVVGSSSVPTTQAYLDKIGELVNPDYQLVGYNIGGN